MVMVVMLLMSPMREKLSIQKRSLIALQLQLTSQVLRIGECEESVLAAYYILIIYFVDQNKL